MKVFKKTPDGILDYGLDWVSWLEEGDTIVASEWEADTGVTVDSDEFTTTLTTAFISGGSIHKSYNITNTITTDGGRTTSRSIRIDVVPKIYEE